MGKHTKPRRKQRNPRGPDASGRRVRPDQIELRKRVARAAELMSAGWPNRTIARTLVDEYPIAIRTARHYVDRAMQEILTADDGVDIVRRKALWRARLEQVFRSATEHRQYAAAVSAARECLKLDGIVDSDGNVTIVVAPGANAQISAGGPDPLLDLFRRMAGTVPDKAAESTVIDVPERPATPEKSASGENGPPALVSPREPGN